MLLTGQDIKRETESGQLVLTPFREARIRSASYVLSLGDRFRRWKRLARPIDLWSANAASEHLDEPFDQKTFVIDAGEFVLGCTLEAIAMPDDRFGIISPLSHIARFGLSVTGGADLVSPGYGQAVASRLTLELFNHNCSPLKLTAGMPIAHLRVGTLEKHTVHRQTKVSIYEGLDAVVGPKLFEEWFAADRGVEDA